jgi:hypothetical protein
MFLTTGRHDIAEILLKVALNTKYQIHSRSFSSKDIFSIFPTTVAAIML